MQSAMNSKSAYGHESLLFNFVNLSADRTSRSVRFGLGAALVSIYGASYHLLGGQMLAAPLLLTLALAVSSIWISVEDFGKFSIPLWALGVYVGLSVLIGFNLASNYALHVATGLLFAIAFEGLNRAFQQWKGHTALGRADAFLIAGSGFMLGPFGTVHVVLIASICGIAAIALRSFLPEKQIRDPLAFGPFLVFATWLVLLEPQLLM